MTKICFITFGCKLNQSETFTWQEKLNQKGIRIVSINQQPDCFIINACAVTQKAEKELRQKINLLKRKYSGTKIIVTGCYASLDKNLADFVIPRLRLLKFLSKIIKKSGQNRLAAVPIKTRALIKIQDGCNNYCSYCIVPFLRGPIKHFSQSRIINEVRHKERNGFQEIVLVGTDLQQVKNFIGLLKIILQKTTISRIRLSSLWPTAVTPELLNLIKKESRICPHLHLSIQSGSNRILKLMNRRYKIRQVTKIIKQAQKIKNLILTADFIVGFPGETNKDFLDTVRLIKKVRFFKIHVFRYSRRPKTLANKMSDQIDDKIKKERANKLSRLNLLLNRQARKGFLKKTINVLIEEKRNNFWTGLTPNYLRIYLKSKKDLKNQLVWVKLLKLWQDGIYGKIIN